MFRINAIHRLLIIHGWHLVYYIMNKIIYFTLLVLYIELLLSNLIVILSIRLRVNSAEYLQKNKLGCQYSIYVQHIA